MSSGQTSNYVGRSVPRREDEYLLRGQGQFLDDLPEPRNTLHLAFVLSPHAHARIVSIDTSAAESLDGVIAVITGAELAKLARPMDSETTIAGYTNSLRSAIAVDKVRFVGEHVVAILAEHPYVAQDAIDRVQVEYEALPAVSDMEAALAPNAPLVHDHVAGNVVFSSNFSVGEVEDVFAGKAMILKERFRTGWVGGTPIEPRGCFAMPDHTGDSFTLYTSTQIPHIVRTGVANHLGIAETKLRVVVPEVGGGFGTKANVYPEELVTVALARKFRRAVKWVQDRREDLLNNIHARNHLYDIEVAFTPDGVIQAMRLDLLTNGGAYTSFPFGCTLEATGGARMIVGPYRIRNYAYQIKCVATHTCPSGAYRGVAQPSCFMAIEGMMDRIGRHLSLDPAQVRLRNLVTQKEMPWVSAVGVRYDTGSYIECLERALNIIGYDAFRTQQSKGQLVDGKYRGIGICCFTESTGTGAPGWRARGLSRVPGFDSAIIRVEPTGKITAAISQAGAGQGHLTTFAQLVADQLGARIEDVNIIEGDTAVSPYGSGTVASRSAVTAGGAVIRAGTKVAAKMRRIAAELLEADVGDIELRHGRASVKGVEQLGLSFEEIARCAHAMGKPLPDGEEYGLEATDHYDPPMVTIANAVHIVEVSVDAEDATVTIERYVVVHDCGRVINPMIVNGQIHGGTVQGIGEALMEEFVYNEEGQLLNANLLDYLLPTAMDVPNFEIEHIETPTIDAVGGFKGVGEGGVIGAVPAVTNAVADALSGLGANVNRVPMRPSYLHGLIQQGAPPAEPVMRTE
jgi:carbon-monoxide dehydrogenase large subunit